MGVATRTTADGPTRVTAKGRDPRLIRALFRMVAQPTSRAQARAPRGELSARISITKANAVAETARATAVIASRPRSPGRSNSAFDSRASMIAVTTAPASHGATRISPFANQHRIAIRTA